jgi:hypothetical protein
MEKIDNKGQGAMGAAIFAVIALISILIVQVVFQAFYLTNSDPKGAVGALNNSSGGTVALIQLFGLLIAVGAILVILRMVF